MEIRFSPNQTDYQKLGTDELRKAFLVDSFFKPDALNLVYTDADRAVIGSAVPGSKPLPLAADAELRAAFFCERRELGVLNIGGTGEIKADGKTYELDKLDCLYAGRGTREIIFLPPTIGTAATQDSPRPYRSRLNFAVRS